jgi:hypothetical protein
MITKRIFVAACFIRVQNTNFLNPVACFLYNAKHLTAPPRMSRMIRNIHLGWWLPYSPEELC